MTSRAMRKQRQVTVVGDRVIPHEEAQILRLAVSHSIRERNEHSRLARRESRLTGSPERLSVGKAMLAVEERLVKALWVLERALPEEGAAAWTNRNGIEYLRERLDHYAAGQWQDVAPRPALPTGKEIDEAIRVKSWLRYLDPVHARVLSLGAMSKRGDAGRRVRWTLIRSRLPELKHYSERSLRHFYSESLRHIVGELTMQRMIGCVS